MKGLTTYELSVLLDFFHGKEVNDLRADGDIRGEIKMLLKFGLIIDRRVGYSITDKGKAIVEKYLTMRFE